MKILKDRRGIALENALVFMITVFSLCFLLSSFALIGHHQFKIDEAMVDNKLELDQIGERFLICKADPGEEFVPQNSEYKYDLSEHNVLKVKYNDNDDDDSNDKLLLYVKIEYDDVGQINVVEWRYS